MVMAKVFFIMSASAIVCMLISSPISPSTGAKAIAFVTPHLQLPSSRRAPLNLARTGSISSEISDSAKVAASVLALLGSEEESRSVEPNLAKELLSCFRFLVPPIKQGFGSKKWNKGVNDLIWWPPKGVMEIARNAVEWGGDSDVIYLALDSANYQVPDIENCKEDKCTLTKSTLGRRFKSKEINLYLAFLFETIAALSPSAGLNTSLNRYDLFHGHLFLASNTGRLGILFHAKEYPAYNKESFPAHLGYCQTGSNVPYDDSMNLRNILWLAPMPDCSMRRCSTQWLAAGALVVLDAHPAGIIYKDLVGQWVQEFRTIYEDEFGDVILDVNYLNLANGSSENNIYLC